MMHYDGNYPDWVYPDDGYEKPPSKNEKEKNENTFEKETPVDRPQNKSNS